MSALLLVCACQDPATAPLPLTVTAEPVTTTSGAVITLSSEQFLGLTLAPSPDTLRPNRWTNFAVLVGTDTADSWRVGPTQIAFRVPPVLTGNYDASITATGYDRASASFFAAGLAFPTYWGGLNPYTNVTSGTVFPGRGVLVAESSEWPGFSTGYGLIDLQDQRLRMYSELQEAPPQRVRMNVPGPSYRPDHFVFDLSPAGSAAATVWRADPWTLVDSLPCGNPRGDYTAVEMSATTCLSLGFGAVVKNGTDTLIPDFFAAPWGEFRLAPGGEWAVVRTELSHREVRELAMSWPVFDRSGNIAYTIDTLFHVTGGAFSSAGDTLFLTASVHDTTAANSFQGSFSVVALETTTGRTLATRSFPSSRALQDLTLDPARPLLYVGGVQTEMATDGSSALRQYLTVLDRRTLDVVADMPAPWDQYKSSVSDATLLYQGGRVSVVGWCGFDCGGLYVFTFDLP